MSDRLTLRSRRFVVAALLLLPAFVTAQDQLAPPRNLRVVDAGLRQLTLEWLPSSDPGVAGYVVYRQDPGATGFKEVGTVKGWQAHRFTDDGSILRRLQDAATYTYAVAAFGQGGIISAPSPSVQARTAGPPVAIADLKAEGGPRRAQLQWRASPELSVTGYRIWRSPERDAEYSRVGSTARRQDTTFTDAGLDDRTDYYYMVTAVNSVGLESEPCQPVVARTASVPLTPMALQARSNALNQVQLRWEPNPEPRLSHYEVLRSTKSDRGYRIIGRVAARQPFYQDLEVRSGTLYFYSVVAVDLDQLKSPPAPPVRAFTAAPPLPPTGVQARVAFDQVLLEWEPSSDPNVVGFVVYQKRRYHWQVVARVAEPRYVAAGLKPGSAYKFRLTAYLANGLESKPTEPLAVDLDRPVPAEEELPLDDALPPEGELTSSRD